MPESWRHVFGDPKDSEAEMIEFSQDTTDGVRLSCQTRATPEMDGMELGLPDSQHY